MKKIFLPVLGMLALLASCTPDAPIPESNLVVFDFESVPESILAGPTAYGENMYSSYTGAFSSYTDPATGLSFSLNGLDMGAGLECEMYYGGIFASTWNDKETEGYLNQCSVYYADPATGNGGYLGSRTFGVAYEASGMMGPDYPTVIRFDDPEKAVQFESIQICNSTYAYLSMKNGDSFAKIHSYEDADLYGVTISGYDAQGFLTGQVTHYLSDFRTAGAAGIIDGWHKVDLAPLGDSVHELRFVVDSSDVGAYGMNTPAYFCIDNISFYKN